MTETPEAQTPPAPRGVAVDYAAPEPPGRRLGKGFLPAAASFYVPGLGQLIAGDRNRAAVWFVAWLVCAFLGMLMLATPALIVGLIVLLPAQLILTLACVVDAFRRGRASPRRMLGRAAVRIVAGVGLILAAMFLHPAVPAGKLVRARWAEAFVMPTSGMAPALMPGDRIIVHKRMKAIGRWDLVAFDSPQTPGQKWVQRVAGLPGETVELVNGELLVNGVAATRPPGAGPYQPTLSGAPGNAAEGNPLTLGADEYFVLGDNSPISLDGRYWDDPPPGRRPGVLPRDRIIGKVTTIYWPFARWRRF